MSGKTYARLAVYYFLFFSTIAVFSPYISLFLAAQGLRDSEVGIVLAVIPMVGILVQPIWGIINDRLHLHKLTLFVGLLVMSIVLVFLRSAHSLGWFIVGAVVIALFQPVLMPINDSIAVHAAGIRGYGKVRMFGSLGYAVFIFLISKMMHTTGVGAFPYLYLGAVVLTLPGLVFLPAPARNRSLERTSPYSGIYRLMRNRSFVLVLLFTLFVMTTQGMSNNLFTLYFLALHRPLVVLGFLYAVSALSELPFFFLSGRWIERFGAERVFLLAAFVYILRWIVLAFTPPTWVIVVVQLCNGVSFGLAFSAGIAIAKNVSDESTRVTAQTLYSAVNTGVASIAGSVIGGLLLEHYGPSGIYVIAALFCIVGFVLMAGYVRRTSRSLRAVEEMHHTVV